MHKTCVTSQCMQCRAPYIQKCHGLRETQSQSESPRPYICLASQCQQSSLLASQHRCSGKVASYSLSACERQLQLLAWSECTDSQFLITHVMHIQILISWLSIVHIATYYIVNCNCHSHHSLKLIILYQGLIQNSGISLLWKFIL